MIGSIILQIILIALNALFASAEIAVISVSDTKLRILIDEGNSAAKKILSLKEKPSKFLSTIQVAITLSGFLGSAFAADSFSEPLVSLISQTGIPVSKSILNTVSVLLITIIISYFSIVFGELVPKRIAMKDPEKLALKVAGVLNFVSKIFAPLVWLLTVSTNGILRSFNINPEQEEDTVTEEEIRTLIMEGNKKGTIQPEETEMIQNVFEFDDMTVEQICTHRRDVVYLSTEDSMEEWENTIHENRHTYYLVCGEEQDDIVGVLDTKDYFRMDYKDRETIMANAVDPAFLIPETMRANVLFRNMKESRQYFAVVIDEYGGLSGIITLHDLVETLVGELEELDAPSKPKSIEQLSENSWKIQGSAELDDICEALDIELPENDCDTFNGFVCELIDRVPDDGETFKCETDSLKIEVRKVENHMVLESIVSTV